MNEFVPLSRDLEGLFESRIHDLPKDIRCRVEREFHPFDWTELSPGQRQSLAAQRDNQVDPSLEDERQFWWEHFGRMTELERAIAKWEAVPTLTASDLAIQQARLDELRREHARLRAQAQRAAQPTAPEKGASASSADPDRADAQSTVTYVAYPHAFDTLRKRFEATCEEIAAWVYLGPLKGGLAAYRNGSELVTPPRFDYSTAVPGRGAGPNDYVAPLMACWFQQDEIARFVPIDRYMVGQGLIVRWSQVLGNDAKAFALAKVAERRLTDLRPIAGLASGSAPSDETLFPLEHGLFRVSDVEAIESTDFGPAAKFPPVQESPADRRQRLTQWVAEEKAAGTKAYLQAVAHREGISASRVKQLTSTPDGTPKAVANWIPFTPRVDRGSSTKPKRKR